MNKVILLEYYNDKLKEYQDKNENRLYERLIANLLMDAKCMMERINKGEFDEKSKIKKSII